MESLHEWCARYDVPGITGVDTRAITSLLRDQGTTLGRLVVGDDVNSPRPKDDEYWDPSKDNLVAQASTPKPFTLNQDGQGPRIAVLDFGFKANILRSLVRRDAVVTVLPWDHDFNAIRDQFDGLFLSNGPGDPKMIMDTAMRVRKTIHEWNKPIFGICMGHQILGLAAGLEAYRMTFGNRGHNQPVLALASSGSIKAGRVYVTVSHLEPLRRSKTLTPAFFFFLFGFSRKTISTLFVSPRSSPLVGRHSSSIVMILRWRVSSRRRNRVNVSGAYSSTQKALVGHSILSR